MRFEHKKVILAGIAGIAALIFFSGLYLHQIYTLLDNEADSYMREVSIQAAATVNERIAKDYGHLTAAAHMITEMGAGNTREAYGILENAPGGASYSRVGVVLRNGGSVDSSGTGLESGAAEKFAEAFKSCAERGLGVPRCPLAGPSGASYYFIAPFMTGNGTSGFVYGAMDAPLLSEVISIKGFDGEGYFFITDSTGKLIMGTDHANSLQSRGEYTEEVRWEIFKVISGSKENPHTVFSVRGRRVVAEPLGISDWYMLSAVPDAAFSYRIQRIIFLSTILCIAVNLSVILAAVLLYHRRIRRQSQLIRAAHTDDLTGLLNSKGFDKAAQELLERSSPESYALVDLDINDFENFNSLYGFDTGNSLLLKISKALKDLCQYDELCARLESDHFACLLRCSGASGLASRLAIFNQGLRPAAEDISILISYGIYIIKDPSQKIETIRERASAAKHTVKGNFEKNIALYDEALHNERLRNSEMASYMESSLLKGEFEPYYQPKYDIRANEIVGAEALAHWNHPREGSVPPELFVKVFEKNGLVTKLDWFMYEEVCKKLSELISEGVDPVPVSINFSRAHLYEGNFMYRLIETAGRYRIPPDLLEIEFTESMFLAEKETLIRIIGQLHKSGFKVSIDDFGSGFSSLNMLKDISFDIVKLDRGFLNLTNDRGKMVIESTLYMAKRLRLLTVAEGVETAEQLDFLRKNGCDIAQGYYFSKPVQAAEFSELLRDRTGGDKNICF